MAKQDYELKSGAKLYVSIPPFKEALGLLKAVTKASADMPSAEDVGRAVLVSPEAEAALAKVLNRCTYDGMRLSEETFDDPKTTEKLRGDYLEICGRVIEVTCGVFLGQTSSTLNGNGTAQPSGQK